MKITLTTGGGYINILVKYCRILAVLVACSVPSQEKQFQTSQTLVRVFSCCIQVLTCNHKIISNTGGGFIGGSRGSLEPPLDTNYFIFMGNLCEIRQRNPPFSTFEPPSSEILDPPLNTYLTNFRSF